VVQARYHRAPGQRSGVAADHHQQGTDQDHLLVELPGVTGWIAPSRSSVTMCRAEAGGEGPGRRARACCISGGRASWDRVLPGVRTAGRPGRRRLRRHYPSQGAVLTGRDLRSAKQAGSVQPAVHFE
jgi:hypothetical protein